MTTKKECLHQSIFGYTIVFLSIYRVALLTDNYICCKAAMQGHRLGHLGMAGGQFEVYNI